MKMRPMEASGKWTSAFGCVGILGSLLGIASASAHVGLCTSETPVDGLCECRLADLRPTQLSVGMREVMQKKEEIQNLGNDPQKLETYKRTHPEPTVLGPEGKLYIIDHHHLALAMTDEGQVATYCQIKAHFSDLSIDAFWAQMSDKHWVYPYDENGKGPLPYSEIPTSVTELKDDPYRSLAGFVQQAGGYGKSPEPFQQFLWADYFRASNQLSPDFVKDHFDEAVKVGVKLAHSPDARHLPGFISEDGEEKGKGKKKHKSYPSQLFGWLFGSAPQPEPEQ